MGRMHCFICILCFGPNPPPLSPKQLSLLFLPLTSVFSTSFPWRYTIFLICIKNAPSISLSLKALPDHYVLLNHSLLSFPLQNQPPSVHFLHSSPLPYCQSHQRPLPRLPLVSMGPALSPQVPSPHSSQSNLLKYKSDLFNCPLLKSSVVD